jgi:hypothetical protein
MLLAVLLQKGSQFGHLKFKLRDVRGHNPVAYIPEKFVS